MPLDSSRIINAFQSGYGTGKDYRERTRKQRLAEILGQAYEPGVSQQEVDAIPGTIRSPDFVPRDPSFNFLRAAPQLAQEGFAPEAIALQMQLDAPKRELQKLAYENYLKRQGRMEDLAMFQNMFGGNMGAGTSLKYGPQGPEITIDPTKAAQLGIDQAKLWFDTGIRPGGVPSGPAAPSMGGLGGLPPKQAADVTAGARSAVDTNFAREYTDFVAAGGYADIDKQLQQLREVSDSLGTYLDTSEGKKFVPTPEGQTFTGPYRGLLPDWVRSSTNPQAIAAKNAVEEVVQRNLRLVLGAQFTEKEGERLIARAYNPQLPPEENKKRVDRLIEQIEAAARAKSEAAQYFETHGTLAGYQGRLPTLSDFDPDKRTPIQPERRQTTNTIDFSKLPVTRGR